MLRYFRGGFTAWTTGSRKEKRKKRYRKIANKYREVGYENSWLHAGDYMVLADLSYSFDHLDICFFMRHRRSWQFSAPLTLRLSLFLSPYTQRYDDTRCRQSRERLKSRLRARPHELMSFRLNILLFLQPSAYTRFTALFFLAVCSSNFSFNISRFSSTLIEKNILQSLMLSFITRLNFTRFFFFLFSGDMRLFLLSYSTERRACNPTKRDTEGS